MSLSSHCHPPTRLPPTGIGSTLFHVESTLPIREATNGFFSKKRKKKNPNSVSTKNTHSGLPGSDWVLIRCLGSGVNNNLSVKRVFAWTGQIRIRLPD